jgi:hypothetical protein
MKPKVEIHAGGTAPTLLTDLRDIGPFVARIIKDPRTLNKFVFTYSDVLSENEIFALMEEMSGEKIEQRKYVILCVLFVGFSECVYLSGICRRHSRRARQSCS